MKLKKVKIDLKKILRKEANWEHKDFGVVANFISGLGEDGVVKTIVVIED